MQLDKNLPWEKLAEPQADFSDLDMIWYVADRLYQYQKPPVDSEVTMFSGRVAIKLFDDGVTRSTSNYTEYPKEKFLTGNKVQLLEDTLKLTPYAEHVARFLVGNFRLLAYITYVILPCITLADIYLKRKDKKFKK
jgi:hypothetical protein